MIDLTAQQARCTIDPRGAWVTRLDRGDDPLLFPRTELAYDEAKKLRGGMHVCLPNFGPDHEGTLAQHGFGRTAQWSVTTQDDTQVTLRLTGGNDTYETLESTLVYTLSDTHFSATLRCRNTGSETLRVAPGFHPYFFVPEQETRVLVNDTPYQLDHLTGTEFIESEAITLCLGPSTLQLSQSHLPVWALWTDRQRNYVCCEPTVGGNRFLAEPTPSELLAPGQELTYTCTLSWAKD